MSFQTYLDAVKTKNGESPAEFAKLATQKTSSVNATSWICSLNYRPRYLSIAHSVWRDE
jgi:hypothetical protein